MDATRWLTVASVALFLTCSFLFFSSFLGNYPQGVRDAVTTYTYWTRTGMTQHAAPWRTYLVWLLREEAPIFILAAIGTFLAMVQRRSRLAVFAGIWALVLLAVYSVIPYKTPWVLLNIIVPMSIVGGAGVQILRDYFVEHYSGISVQFFQVGQAYRRERSHRGDNSAIECDAMIARLLALNAISLCGNES
jgi:predicted membrane-bound mannosyltransferase